MIISLPHQSHPDDPEKLGILYLLTFFFNLTMYWLIYIESACKIYIIIELGRRYQVVFARLDAAASESLY